MDAVEFVLEKRRMCMEICNPDCKDCELHKENCCTDMGQTRYRTEKAVAIVEKWSKEHPNWTEEVK